MAYIFTIQIYFYFTNLNTYSLKIYIIFGSMQYTLRIYFQGLTVKLNQYVYHEF